MSEPIICRPDTIDVRRILACPTCKQRRRFVGHDPVVWYSVILTCCACGDSWSDGERLVRPFARGWREKSAAKARAAWATAVRYGSPEHAEFVRERLEQIRPVASP